MMTTRVAGATPKVTMSARESIWIPCMLAALRIRAAKPSSASKTMAKRMRIALVARIDGQETPEKGCAGSQTRIPAKSDLEIAVRIGDKVQGGLTVLARQKHSNA